VNIKIMVCTRCWLKEEDIPANAALPVTASMEDGVIYVCPHKADCRRVK
jgi:hypothetical protein